MNKRDQMRERILRHGLCLLRTFPKAERGGCGPVELCKRLRRIELAAHRRAESQCNDYDYDEQAAERADNRALDTLDEILGWREAGIPVFINHDPRGYALKIDDAWVREHKSDIHRDWGGYGILAPDLS